MGNLRITAWQSRTARNTNPVLTGNTVWGISYLPEIQPGESQTLPISGRLRESGQSKKDINFQIDDRSSHQNKHKSVIIHQKYIRILSIVALRALQLS